MTATPEEIAAELRETAMIASGESLRRGCQNCGIAANLAETAADAIERQAAEIAAKDAEIARLRSIIGDTVWCEACGSVVPLDDPACDCIQYGNPESRRLTVYDAGAIAKIAELRALTTWRPIAEAPRDGTPFLALNHDGEIWCARYGDDGRMEFRTNHRYEPRSYAIIKVDGEELLREDRKFAADHERWMSAWTLWTRLYEFAPTHFAPLPPPPADTMSGEA